MRTIPEWNEIRAALQGSEVRATHQAAVAVGRIRAEELPEDIADSVISLFRHADPEVRVEAVRAIGVHWRLSRAVGALAAVLEHDEDSQVRLSAISGLGALAAEHTGVRCLASRALAGAVLNERLDEYERMVAYLEVLRVEGRISFKEYINRDRDIPENLASFDIDRPWVQQLALQDCPTQ